MRHCKRVRQTIGDGFAEDFAPKLKPIDERDPSFALGGAPLLAFQLAAAADARRSFVCRHFWPGAQTIERYFICERACV